MQVALGQGAFSNRESAPVDEKMIRKLLHNVARARIKAGLTQTQLAVAIECSLSTIKAVEILKLRLSVKLAERIAKYLKVPVHWLLTNDLNSPIPSVPAYCELDVYEWV